MILVVLQLFFFFFQAEDGIRDFCLSRGLGDVYKRQIHGFSSERILPVYRKYRDNYFVSISDNDRAEGLNYVATVYNGIAVDSFDYSDAPGDYLLFFGRISYEKGTHRAIEVAKETGMTLKIAGLVASEHRAYFEKCVKPEIDEEQIQYLG